MGTPTLLHRYNLADFTRYNYYQIYFQSAGVFEIDGDVVIGVPGLKMGLKTGTRPVYVSGTDNLYLLGDLKPDLCPVTLCGSEGTEDPIETPYYVGNLSMGGHDAESETCPTVYCYYLSEDNCFLTDELGCSFII
jgi:hypothetical protein